MNIKKEIMRWMATLLIASLALTGSVFTVLAENNIIINDIVKDADYYSLQAKDKKSDVEVNVNGTEILEVEVFQKGKAASTNNAVAIASNEEEAKERFTTANWESSNSGVISVEKDKTDRFKGIITGKSQGDATITFTSDFGEKVIFNVTVSDNITKPEVVLKLDAEELSVEAGKTKKLNATVIKNEIEVPNPDIKWTSSDPSATIDKKGIVTGVKEGTAIITAEVEIDGKKVTATCKVTIIPVNQEQTKKVTIELNQKELQIKVGGDSGVIIAVVKENGEEICPSIEWSSSNPDIATVEGTTEEGWVIAKAEGEAIITAKVGDVEATCKVIVPKPEISIKSSLKSFSLKVGTEKQILAIVTGIDIATIAWSSSDESVATVDEYGKVTGKKVGKAIITAETENRTDTCEVNVTEAGLKLNKNDLELEIGEEETLETEVVNEEDKVTNAKIKWELGEESQGIIEVDKDGKVTAKDAGRARIIVTAKVGDEELRDECAVTIMPKLTLDKETLTLLLDHNARSEITTTVSEGAEITRWFYRPGGGILNLEWRDNNRSVRIQPRKIGEATVYAIAVKNGISNSKTCKVTVIPNETTTKVQEIDQKNIPEKFKNNTEAQQKIDNQTAEIKETISNIVDAVAEKLEKADIMLNEIKEIPEGSTLKMQSATTTMKVEDKDGNPVVVVDELTFNINLISKEGEILSHDMLKNNETEISVDVPLPVKGINPEWKFATIRHYADESRKILLNTLYSQIFEEDEEKYITIKTKTFSPFVLTFSKTNPELKQDTSSNNSSGKRNRSSSEINNNTNSNRYAMTGTWEADATGWKFTKSNGETAMNTWGFINNNYYYFDASGKMVTGWTLVDGHWYYLNPAENLQGTMMTGVIFDPAYNAYFYADTSGAMVTGWYQIGEKWYYFNPVSDNSHVQGQLLADTYIDGYYLGADGARVSVN